MQTTFEYTIACRKSQLTMRRVVSVTVPMTFDVTWHAMTWNMNVLLGKTLNSSVVVRSVQRTNCECGASVSVLNVYCDITWTWPDSDTWRGKTWHDMTVKWAFTVNVTLHDVTTDVKKQYVRHDCNMTSLLNVACSWPWAWVMTVTLRIHDNKALVLLTGPATFRATAWSTNFIS